ncbi:MAG: hypothetical protein IPN49_15825 [Saprospiraceae bacterium]|nr:hypothetical protein [Saprospiraceae bacterium]
MHFKAKYFKNIEYVDGPMIISKVRNEIVHGNLQSSYFNVEKHDLYLVYDLVIGYVELVLINLLKIKVWGKIKKIIWGILWFFQKKKPTFVLFFFLKKIFG